MRYAVLAMAICLIAVGAANATIPERTNCSVTPCDTYGGLILSPDYNIQLGMVMPRPAAEFVVNVRNANNDPIPSAFVEVVLGTPGNHCLCIDAVLTGTTDVNGDATFNISGGGCTIGTNAARIIANSVEIRAYDAVRSPDYENGTSDCLVGLPDFGFFATNFGGFSEPCTDYNGSGQTELFDFSVFAQSFGYTCEELAK
ncbi:MAG: hypothetical protein V1774_10565 [Candidatus Eisenbacteria bacterium]